MERDKRMENLVGRSKSWSGLNVLVTGATGLLGTELVSLLIPYSNVVCLVRDKTPSRFWAMELDKHTNIVYGDILDENTLRRTINEYYIDVVFHLAAQTIVGTATKDAKYTFEVNVQGTWNMLNACTRYPIESNSVKAIVVASSDKAYGDQPVLPYVETNELLGVYPYDSSKVCVEKICNTYATTYKLPISITRCGNLFGPGDLNFNRIIPGTIRSILRNENPQIRSDGLMVRDYIYIRDAADAYMLIAEDLLANHSTNCEAYNISYNNPKTVINVVESISNQMGNTSKPDILNQANNEIQKQYLSSDKIINTLGWKPSTNFDQGLTNTIEWYTQAMIDGVFC